MAVSWSALADLSEFCWENQILFALAVLAVSGSSFAQSSVTISGVIDFAAAKVSGNTAGTTVSTTVGTATTSVIRFDVVEDLGGGMKAVGRYALDPRTLSNDSYTVATTTQGLQPFNTGLARDEAFVGLDTNMGNIKLGSPNSIGLTSYLGASALGTGVGSGYAPFTGTMTMAVSNIRYNRSVRYDSPTMNGFTVSALYAPGGDESVTSASQVNLIPNSRAVTELGLRYVSGPLNVSFVNISQAAQTNNGGWGNGLLNNTTAISGAPKTSVNILNAAYKIGATTLMAGWNDGDALAQNAGAVRPSNGSRFAVRQDIGAVALIAQYTAQERSGVKATVMGLRADYALSKRSTAYVGYEDWDTGAALSTAAQGANLTSGTRKIASVGVRHSF